MLNSPERLLFLSLLVWTNSYSSQSLRILALLPSQLKSHSVTPVQLLRGLAAKGHKLDVYTHYPSKDSLPGYTDFSLKGSLPEMSNNLTYKEGIVKSGPQPFLSFASDWGNEFCQIMKLPVFLKLRDNPPTDPPYDIIITQFLACPCYLAWGPYLDIPVVGLVPSLLFDYMHEPFGDPVNLAVDPSLFVGSVAPMSFLERLNNVITFYHGNWMLYWVVKGQNDFVKDYFGPGYPDVMSLHRDMALVLTNNDPVVNGMKAFAPKVIPIGGLHAMDNNETLPEDLKKWMDESVDGFVYVTFGSMTRIESFPRKIIDAFYKAFNNIAPIRVLMKIANPHELPPGLPQNVITRTWFQQIQILKHKNIKGFITHGGLLSTQEAIHFGVPLIGIPLFADQYLNIETYVKKNVAVRTNFDDITEETLTSALNLVLKNPLYRTSMQKLSRKSRDRPMSQLDTAIFWIEYVARHGKDALRSPIVDLPWWQASLIDVYGFLVSSVILALYFVKIVCKKLFLAVVSRQGISEKKKN
ncbi:hypothetical protein QAD02_008953 [Eretmocerus hayati]|uniref:Uncharacterized protein n=1 Tax=Eretmocerus hayati TaxID=131215 RepID=A0ACC2N8R2_9HYME|nr:hypothetical protein QAD02_008953 [Eretmocerus hayati]